MKKLILFLSALLPLMSCAQKFDSFDEMATAMADDAVPILTVDQVKVLEVKGKSVVFLDTRKIEEYKTSHIENAIWIGYDDYQKSKVESLDRNKTYIIYCSVGYRSGKIGKKMIEMGFKNVFNLYGGIFDWVNNGNIVYDANGIAAKTHPYDDNWGKWLKKEYRSK